MPEPPAGRKVDRQRYFGRFSPRIQVAQADDVQVVIGVHVPDDDGREVVRIQDPLEIPDDPLTDVEEQRRRAPFDEEAGRRRRRVGGGGRAAEHGQAKAVAKGSAHGAILGLATTIGAALTTPWVSDG